MTNPVQKVKRPEHFPKNGIGKSYLITETDAYMDQQDREIADLKRKLAEIERKAWLASKVFGYVSILMIVVFLTLWLMNR